MNHPLSYYGNVAVILLTQTCLSLADCECGYRVSDSLLFTDTVQTDFTQLQSLAESTDWKIKHLRLDYIPNKGRYGRIVEDRNVILNPVLSTNAGLAGSSAQGSNIDAGLQLVVRSTLVETNLVSSGQIQSKREDIRYGSFRAYMKSTPINGTCAASFWYHNDSQEIDMELLSRQQERDTHPINLSVHSEESVANNYDATDTTGFIEGKLGFDPAQDFHEYRYDWSSDVVRYYVDGKWVGDIHDFIPSTPGYFQLSHWSNGFQGWSAGPPLQDAMITVGYFMGYFNSTDPDRVRDFEARCRGGENNGRVCLVSDLKSTSFELNHDGGSTAMKVTSMAVSYGPTSLKQILSIFIVLSCLSSVL